MAILTLNGSNDVIPQPLVPFGGHINNDRLSACCGDWQFGRLPTAWRIWNHRISFTMTCEGGAGRTNSEVADGMAYLWTSGGHQSKHTGLLDLFATLCICLVPLVL